MDKPKCKYSSHNDKEGVAKINRPDGKSYIVDIPEDVKSKKIDWFKWMYPLEDVLTTKYYRDIELNKIFNIRTECKSTINRFTFHYDMKDSIVEVYDVTYADHRFNSCYRDIKDLFNLDDIKDKLLKEINRELKFWYDAAINEDKKLTIATEIKFLEYQYRTDYIKI